MKRHVLNSFLLLPLFASAQTVIWSDDFESYADGAYCAESSGGTWTTWSGTPGSSEDAIVTINQQHSGSKSIFVDGPTGNGPVDLVHEFNLTSGHYEFALWINVEDGAGGYFNLLHDFNGNSSEWAADVFFLPDQSGYVLLDNVEYNFLYTPFTWHEFKADINIDGDEASYYFDGTLITTQPWSTLSSGGASATNNLAALDIFAFSGGGGEPATFYIDDISLTQLDVSVTENPGLAVAIKPNPVADELTVELDRAIGPRTVVELLDPTGRSVHVGRSIFGNTVKLGMAALPAGLYTLRLTDGASSRVEKVVKR